MAAGSGGGTLWRHRTRIVAAEGSNGENSGRKGRVVEGGRRAVAGGNQREVAREPGGGAVVREEGEALTEGRKV